MHERSTLPATARLHHLALPAGEQSAIKRLSQFYLFHHIKSECTLKEISESLENLWLTLLMRSATSPPGKPKLARYFLHLVELHFKKERRPAFYALQLNLSSDYLREICRGRLRQGPFRCIALRSALEALRLLEETDLSVKEIAFRLGFEDASYFNRFFKKHFGKTPSEMRLMG
ncbi:MAG: AraC family transcriptional regulator [Saprospiraceae bacterium]|nr:MAG: AraC family transcriptional regulator [Saprospiraceae bacterium]